MKGQFPLQSFHREAFYFVSGFRNFFHLQFIFCTHKQNLNIIIFHFQGICNGYGRENMASCPTSAYDHSLIVPPAHPDPRFHSLITAHLLPC